MRSKSTTLTEQELELMKLVWELGEPTVRDVYEAMREQRKVAYTTVMTMLNVLVEKGRLEKVQGERAFVYRPTEPREKTVRSMVREFVGRVFDGSARPLLVQLAEDRKLTERDLDEIRKMIRDRLDPRAATVRERTEKKGGRQ